MRVFLDWNELDYIALYHIIIKGNVLDLTLMVGSGLVLFSLAPFRMNSLLKRLDYEVQIESNWTELD